MKTIRDWQRDAHALAVEKGFHSRECRDCRAGTISASFECDGVPECPTCKGTGRVPVDPHSPTRIAACLAAIHGEISEAYECVARGGIYMELHWYDTKTKALITKECTPYQAFLTDPTKRAHFPEYKPEGFPIELADVFLRLGDLAESLGLELENHEVSARLSAPCGRTPEELAAALCLLHDALPYAYEASDEKDEAGLNDALGTLQWIAVSCGVDLLACAELKHEYNRTRPIRHGGKAL